MSARTNFFGEPGEPVPQVDPADIKRAWEASEEERKTREAAGITGLGAVAGGSQFLSEAEFEKNRAIGYRTTLLVALVGDGGRSAPWFEEGKPSEVLLRTMAEIPMEWMRHGVTYVGGPFDQEEFMRRMNDPHQ